MSIAKAQHTPYCLVGIRDEGEVAGFEKDITRRVKTRKRRHIHRRKRREQQQKLQVQIDEAIARVVLDTVEQVLQDEVTQLLRRARCERRNLEDLTIVEARCNKCHSQYRRWFYRGGYYSRGILSFEAWGEIKVPRLSCTCGGMVDFEFVHLAPYGRLWFDVEERARELAGLCVSLRDGVEILAWRNGPVCVRAQAGSPYRLPRSTGW